MTRNAQQMRDELFETLFDEEGIVLSDLMIYLAQYIDVWDKLHKLLAEKVKYFDKFSHIDKIKIIDNKYFIIKEEMWHYLIIDINSKKVLKKEEIINLFDEAFFIDNFKEEKTDIDDYLRFYHFSNFKGSVQQLIDLYNDNQEIFKSSTKIIYKNNIEDAYIYLCINLINGNVQIGFQTPDQFLYEQIFIKQDLTPSIMQDATSRIGLDKMQEMFARIKDIQVPIRHIPKEILKAIEVEDSLSNQSESKEKRASLTKI